MTPVGKTKTVYPVASAMNGFTRHALILPLMNSKHTVLLNMKETPITVIIADLDMHHHLV